MRAAFCTARAARRLSWPQAVPCLPTCLISPTGRMRALAQVLVDDTGALLVLRPAMAPPCIRPSIGCSSPPIRCGGTTGGWNTDQPGGSRRHGGPAVGWQLPGHRLVLRDGECLPAELEAIPALGPIEAERWRLSQGRPLAPNEISDEVNPFELGLADRVSLSKGCYVGQETLAKLATYDGVKQQLRRWCWANRPPQLLARTPPSTISAGGGGSAAHIGGERAGRITSSLRLNAGADGTSLWLGLALVRRQALTEPQLLTGEGTPWRSPSPGVVAPPVGAGSAAS